MPFGYLLGLPGTQMRGTDEDYAVPGWRQGIGFLFPFAALAVLAIEFFAAAQPTFIWLSFTGLCLLYSVLVLLLLRKH